MDGRTHSKDGRTYRHTEMTKRIVSIAFLRKPLKTVKLMAWTTRKTGFNSRLWPRFFCPLQLGRMWRLPSLQFSGYREFIRRLGRLINSSPYLAKVRILAAIYPLLRTVSWLGIYLVNEIYLPLSMELRMTQLPITAHMSATL